MSGNRPKIKAKNKESIFTRMEKALKLEDLEQKGVPMNLMPRLFFVGLLLVLYVGINHNAERLTSRANNLKNEVDELRADYTTLKYDYMFKSKQSEVAKRVAPLGLEESLTPPFKIVVPEDEY